MSVVPLVAHWRGDGLPQLMPVEDTDTFDQVAEKVAFHCIGSHMPEQPNAKQVLYKGSVMPGNHTVAAAGIGVMDFIEVRYAIE
jgi:toluene monooxygenase system protein B